MYTFILSLGQLIKSDKQRTVDEFKKFSSNVTSQMSKFDSLIAPFKEGKISEDDFFKDLNEYFPKQSQQELKDAWNTMCILSDEIIQELKYLQRLQEQQSFKLLIVSETNKTHYDFVCEQFSTKEINLDIKFALSFKEDTLSPQEIINQALSHDPSLINDQPGEHIISLKDEIELKPKNANFSKQKHEPEHQLSAFIKDTIQTDYPEPRTDSPRPR